MAEGFQHTDVTVVTSKTWPVANNDRPSAALIKEGRIEPQNQPHTWSTEQAFFAICGGFAVKSASFYPTERLTFTVQGLLELAKSGLLPSISGDDIEDKSKANTVAKTIVCVQAGWFLFQSLARVQQRLPLSLLELHTLIHIICAFCVYALWWKKPYDVERPIIWTNPHIVDMAALFALEPADLQFPNGGGEPKCVQTASIKLEHVRRAHRSPICSWLAWREVKLALCDRLEEGKSAYLKNGIAAQIDETKVLQQLRRANAAIARLKEDGRHFSWRQISSQTLMHKSKPIVVEESIQARSGTQYVVEARTNLHLDGPLEPGDLTSVSQHDNQIEKSLKSKLFLLISTFYGGMHLLAWNAHFPSAVEMWMWRGSGLAMATGPLSLWLVVPDYYPDFLMRDEETWWFKPVKTAINILSTVLMCIGSVIWTAYPVGRVFVLVEAFASLRSPALGIYETVKWTSFIPHVG